MERSLKDPAGPGRAAGSGSRAHVLRAVQEAAGEVGIDDLAAVVGLHPNTVRFHLDRLVTDGAVERRTDRSGARGRPRVTYVALRQGGAADDPRSYRLLAEILAGVVAGSQADPSGVARDAGTAWGKYLTAEPAPGRRTDATDALGRLAGVLDDVGFDPAIVAADEGDRTEVHLRHCPFLEVATAHPEVVCSVHLGLMQGALERMRAPVTTDRLTPFVEPSLCVATVAPRRSAS
jgi:predicted ArsR family transcriptional regulator